MSFIKTIKKQKIRRYENSDQWSIQLSSVFNFNCKMVSQSKHKTSTQGTCTNTFSASDYFQHRFSKHAIVYLVCQPEIGLTSKCFPVSCLSNFFSNLCHCRGLSIASNKATHSCLLTLPLGHSGMRSRNYNETLVA